MWRRIWGLAIKEFLALLRDKRSRIVLIAPPVVQLLIFAYAATFDLNHISYAFYNEDKGYASRELISHFQGASVFQHEAIIDHNDQIKAMIDNKEVLIVLHIEEEFTRHLLQRQPAQIQVIVDGRNSNTATMALNYVNTILLGFNQYWAERYHWEIPPAELNVRAWFNPNLLSQWFFVPAIVALLMLVVTLLITGLSVAREREQGTFDQLLVTPLTPLGILVGKSLPGLIIGMMEGLFTVFMAIVWFKVPFIGSMLELMLGMVLFLLSGIGIGLMISSLAMTQQQGVLGVFLFMVPSIMLSGFAAPIANMPPLVQYLTYLNPLRYFLIIVRGIFLEGATINNLWPQYWPLALIALFSMLSAAWLFRHRL